jgi:hypothetical protein
MLPRDPAFGLDLRYGFPNTAVTAGGAGDATALNGAAFNTAAQDQRYEAIMAAVFITTALGANETLAVTGLWQDSANGSSWATLRDDGAIAALSGGAGGATVTAGAKSSLSLDQVSETRPYVRYVVTPNLSRAGTDTAAIGGGYVLSGAHSMPVGNPGV